MSFAFESMTTTGIVVPPSGERTAGMVVPASPRRSPGMMRGAATPQLQAAIHWFGNPAKATTVGGVDEPIAYWRGPRRTLGSTLLSHLALPAYTHGSGRGALFVPAMDESAFPPRGRPGPALRAARRGCRWLVGLPNT